MRARALAIGIVLQLATPDAFSYQFLQTEAPNGSIVDLRWFNASFPVPYYVNNRDPLDFSLQAAVDGIGGAFQTWEDIETASITFEFAGTTEAEAFEFFDDRSTFGFSDDPELEGTLCFERCIGTGERRRAEV